MEYLLDKLFTNLHLQLWPLVLSWSDIFLGIQHLCPSRRQDTVRESDSYNTVNV